MRSSGRPPAPWAIGAVFLSGAVLLYHRLSVVEDATTRYLRFDNSLQSAM